MWLRRSAVGLQASRANRCHVNVAAAAPHNPVSGPSVVYGLPRIIALYPCHGVDDRAHTRDNPGQSRPGNWLMGGNGRENRVVSAHGPAAVAVLTPSVPFCAFSKDGRPSSLQLLVSRFVVRHTNDAGSCRGSDRKPGRATVIRRPPHRVRSMRAHLFNRRKRTHESMSGSGLQSSVHAKHWAGLGAHGAAGGASALHPPARVQQPLSRLLHGSPKDL